jgi:hypothetical protein
MPLEFHTGANRDAYGLERTYFNEPFNP